LQLRKCILSYKYINIFRSMAEMCPGNGQDTEITVILVSSHQKGPSVLINATYHNYMDKHFKNTL